MNYISKLNPNSDNQKKILSGRWSAQEHQLFVTAYTTYGKNWSKIAEIVGARSISQVRSHAQKYFLREHIESIRNIPKTADEKIQYLLQNRAKKIKTPNPNAHNDAEIDLIDTEIIVQLDALAKADIETYNITLTQLKEDNVMSNTESGKILRSLFNKEITKIPEHFLITHKSNYTLYPINTTVPTLPKKRPYTNRTNIIDNPIKRRNINPPYYSQQTPIQNNGFNNYFYPQTTAQQQQPEHSQSVNNKNKSNYNSSFASIEPFPLLIMQDSTGKYDDVYDQPELNVIDYKPVFTISYSIPTYLYSPSIVVPNVQTKNNIK